MTVKGQGVELLANLQRMCGGYGMPLLCRGESRWYEEVSSRIWRDHKEAGLLHEAGASFNELEERVADDVRSFCETPDRSTRDVIDELEIAGGKTNQINFTYDVAVAIWFACQEPKSEDGRLILVERSVVVHRQANRSYAPRQGAVLVSHEEGKLPQDKVFAVIRIPSHMKDELLAIIARTNGILSRNTIFSGAIQTPMGYARLQGDTSDITKQLIAQKELELKAMAMAIQGLAIAKPNSRATPKTKNDHVSKPGRGAGEVRSESGMSVSVRALDGLLQDALVGLRGRMAMASGVMYSLNLGSEPLKGVAAKIGQLESGSTGLVMLRMPGLITDRIWEVVVGKVTEIELVGWDGTTMARVSVEFLDAPRDDA